MGRIALALPLTVAIVLASGGVALADHQRAICEVSATAAAKVERGYTLDVRLRTTDGKPVNEAAVTFYEIVELFGRREMLLGTAKTDGQGLTSLAYMPARTGAHEIVVRFGGRDHFTKAEGRLTLEATVANAPYRPEPAPLAAFAAVVPYGVGVVLLAVWALLAFALFGTARGVLIGGRGAPIEKGDIA